MIFWNQLSRSGASLRHLLAWAIGSRVRRGYPAKIAVCVVLGCVCGGFAAPAWGQPKETISSLRRRCHQLLRRAAPLAASRCFARLYRKSDDAKDLWMAARSHQLAAESQRSPYHEIVLRRRAIYYYWLYRKKKPGQSARLKLVIRAQQKALWRAEQVGYAVVWVEGEPKKGSYVLYKRGRVEGSGQLPMREELRPGEYVLVINRKGHHPQRIKLRVRKNETLYHRQRLRPKTENPPPEVSRESRAAPPGPGGGSQGGSGSGSSGIPKIVPWIVLGSSAVVSLVGVILVGVAAGHHGTIRVTPNANDATRLYNDIGGLLPAGIIFTSLGIAGSITAGVLFHMAYSNAH